MNVVRVNVYAGISLIPANLICFLGRLIRPRIAVITSKALMFSQLTVSRI